jgi:hypothetical protein
VHRDADSQLQSAAPPTVPTATSNQRSQRPNNAASTSATGDQTGWQGAPLLWGECKVVDDGMLDDEQKRSTIFTIKGQQDWMSWEDMRRAKRGQSEVEMWVLSAYCNRTNRTYSTAHSSIKNAIRDRVSRLVERVEVMSSNRRERTNQAKIVWKTVRARQIAMTVIRYRAYRHVSEKVQMWWNGRSNESRGVALGQSVTAQQQQDATAGWRVKAVQGKGSSSLGASGPQQSYASVVRGETRVQPPPRPSIRLLEPVVVQAPPRPPPAPITAPPPQPPQPLPSAPPQPPAQALPTTYQYDQQPQQPCQLPQQYYSQQELLPYTSHWQSSFFPPGPPAAFLPQWQPAAQPHSQLPPSFPQHLAPTYNHQPHVHDQRQHLITNFHLPHHLPLPGGWGQTYPMGGIMV